MRPRTLVTAAATVLALAATPAAAIAEDQATLALDGHGTAFVVPDVATLSVQVRSGSAVRVTARSRADARTRSVLAALAGQGVGRAAITTTGITLTRTQVARRKVFYSATNAIQVRLTDVAKVGPVTDAVTRAGADSVDGPSFELSDPSAGRAEATRNALADARRRADDGAAAAGQKVTGIRSIVIDPDSGPASASGGSSSAKASAPAPQAGAVPAPTPVSAGRQEVDATVEVVYTIAPT